MTFDGGGMAVAMPDFNYLPGETRASVKVAQVPYRSALTFEETQALRAAILRWKERVQFLSLCDQRVAVPEFGKIVDFGSAAIPTILADLKREPSYLFLALEAITGEDPVYEGISGNLNAMVGAWIQWIHTEFELGTQNAI